MSEKVKLERVRETEYIVNYHDNGRTLKFKWAGAKRSTKGEMVAVTREVPNEVFEYLQMETNCFKNGELRIAKTEKAKAEIEEMLPNGEEYLANSLSRPEIEALLKGNMLKMKSELKKITSISLKRFVKEIAEELNTQGEGLSKGKNDFIDEWLKPTPSENE